MTENEQSLDEQFAFCENVVESLLKDQLGDSKNPQRNEKLRNCIENLQSLSKTIELLSLFSTNDQIEELPTSSIRYLLVPAYMGYVLQEVQMEIEKRAAYLKASKANYREFLQNLLIYELINFKLPWIDSENSGECNSGIDAPRPTGYEQAVASRQQKVSRLRQIEQMENALAALRIQERRDNDEAAKRELLILLLRLWSIRAIKELDMIEEELKMLEQFEAMRNSQSTSGPPSTSSPKAEPVVKLKPFIIARNEQQKAVFGLGYPSVPTVTVDEWFDQMQKSGGFGKASGKRKNKPYTIEGGRKHSSDEGDDDGDDETKRQAKIRMDEWKDINPRGSGNTYNKG